MNEINGSSKLTINGVDYSIQDLSVVAKSNILDIEFAENKILQLQNELAISKTAQAGYLRAVKKDLEVKKGTGS